MSDQTTKQSKKTRLIIGEVGVDTETGIVGKGHSYDNGKTFTVDDTIYGRIYHANDHGKIWEGIQDQVVKVVAPAKSAADSAVNAADAAVASAQVTSYAVSAIASATAEAKQGANEAMSRAESAWDVATGAKEAVTDFDPLLKSAQSDASKALTQIADTASALSDAKTSFGSDVAEAKQLASTAQTTANNAVESAGENARALASQATALSDAKKAMDSDVASAKGLANAAQETADNAIKSASSVANDLAAVASQAKDNASGITKVTSDVGLLKTTVADNSGNISTIQETAKQIQQAVSDNAGNITTAKQTADSAIAVASDAKSNATVAVQTASGASVTAKNAQGDATTAMTTAQSAVTQASDAKSNATIAVQTASEASVTATNAQGDASFAKQTASDASVQIKNAQGDISKLQTRAGTIEASVSSNSGAIADVQATANQLKASVSDNAGNITVAKQTADSAVAVASDARSNATVAIQTASQASITASNASGQAASAVLTANGAMTTASNAKSDATVAIQTASGASLTATNAKDDATVAKQTASEAKVQASNAESDYAQLSIRAGQIEANVANNSGAIASVQQTANGLTTTVSNIKANGGGVNLLVGTSTASGDVANGNGTFVKGAFNGYDAVKTNGAWSERLIDLKSALGRMNAKAGDWYIISVYVKADKQINDGSLGVYRALGNVDANTNDGFLDGIPMQNKPITTQWQQYSWSFQINDISLQRQVTRVEYSQDTGDNWIYWAGWMLEKGVVTHDWSPAIDDFKNQFTQIKTSIDGVTTTINDPKTGLNATYQTAAGNASTISNVKGDVTQLQTTATGLTSRVGNLESKTNTQQTAIEQNKNAITLKADQTNVDTLKGTVNQLQSSLTVQAGQIQTKVSASDVSGMLTGYATQEYTQSLVTQESNEWNLNLTNLKTDVNAIKTTGGGVNLQQGTGDCSLPISGNGTNVTIEKFDDYTNMIHASGNSSGFYIGYTSGRFIPEVGKTYTFSCDIKGQGQISGGGLRYEGGDDGTMGAITLTDNWTRISNTIHVNAISGTWVIYLNPINGKVDFYVKHIMIEEGIVAHPWSPAPSDMATVTSVTNLSATVDGIQAQVYNSDGSSKITQLSNLIATKVSQGDYNSQITQFQNDINLRVKSADLISQINLQAGTALIQSNKLVLDAGTTVVTGNAFIPVAAIADLTADQVQAGTLKGVKVDFRDSTGTGMIADGSTLTFDVSNTPAGYLSYNGMPVAELPDGSGGNELAIRYRLSTAIIPDDSSGAQATFSKAAQKIAYMTGTSQGKQMLSGLEVHANNHHWLCAVNSDATCNRFEVNDRDGLNIAWHDNTHFWISDGKAKLYKDYDDGQTATKLEVHGWAWVNGWVEAAGHSQHSALSTKTALQSIDDDEMLEMVNNTDLASFLFKTDVASGETHRHIGLIIDDVHDVAQYQAPQDFIAPNGVSRDDDNMIGALFGAVKALTKRIKTLESKVG
nr:MAG TPA: minor structural protein [Caudoviricetes sp.]